MYKIRFNYSKLKGRIIEKCGSQKAFAKLLKIADGTLTSKLQCVTYFTQDEIYRACEYLEIPDDEIYTYFFTETV